MADSPRTSPRRLRRRKALPKDAVPDKVQENDANDKVESEGNQKLYPDLKGLQEKSPNDKEVEENQSDNDVDGTDDAEIVKEIRKPKEDENDSESGIGLILILATLFAILAILLYMFCPIRREIFPDVRAFKANVDALKSKFPSQSKLIWEAVEKLGGDHLNEVHNETLKGPNRPLVFVFTSISRNKKTLTCLAKKIGETFKADNSLNGNVVSGNEIATSSNQKQALDERLRSILDTSDNRRVVIVTEIDSLSYEVASIFFKYCDNEGAPYPRAVFIFTLTMDKEEDFLQQSRKEITRETREYLNDVVWKEGDKAQTDALIARIMDPFPFKVMSEKLDVCSNS